MPVSLETLAKICDCDPTLAAIIKVVNYNIVLCQDVNWIAQAAKDGAKYT